MGYNLPGIIHFDIVAGDKIEIEYAAKGGGSENVSRAKVLPPDRVKKGVVQILFERGYFRCGWKTHVLQIIVWVEIGWEPFWKKGG